MRNRIKRVEVLFEFLRVLVAMVIAYALVLVCISFMVEDSVEGIRLFVLGPFESKRRFGNIISRMITLMLTGAGILGGVREEYGVALNDIVIHRTGELSVVSLIVYVNGEYLHTFRADGIIVSTPTGSTGYNMSAGGPIVDPKAQMILITPINAHNLNSRSIVIGAEDEVVVEIGRRRSQKDETLEVSFDGDTAARLVVGDKFSIRKASDTTRILKLSNKSFLEILSKKMQVYT